MLIKFITSSVLALCGHEIPLPSELASNRAMSALVESRRPIVLDNTFGEIKQVKLQNWARTQRDPFTYS